MYSHRESEGMVTEEFKNGVETFMHQAGKTSISMESGKMFCPCRKCMNRKFILIETVWSHLLNRWFTPHYYIWYQHGEGYDSGNVASSSSNNQTTFVEQENCEHMHHQFSYLGEHSHDHDAFHEIVTDAFHETIAIPENIFEEPNIDAKQFYDMLDAANQPIYDGCREGQSKLSLAARLMSIKTDHNLSEVCMDDWADLIKEYLSEDNLATKMYYEIQKLVFSLGLPSEMIDVCIDNCMIFWKADDRL